MFLLRAEGYEVFCAEGSDDERRTPTVSLTDRTNERDVRRVVIHTDGACSGNPGGWGALLQFADHEKELFSGATYTTSNRMELTAAIKAVSALKRPCRVELYTDSQYLRRGITEWIRKWKRNGWKTADRKPVKNVDLWRPLDDLIAVHKVEWHWVRGHAGHDLNERADALARKGMAPFVKLAKKKPPND